VITREPLEVECLLTADQRRTNDQHFLNCIEVDELGRDNLDRARLTIDQHAAFRLSLVNPKPLDEIDELVEEIRAIEFEQKGSRP